VAPIQLGIASFVQKLFEISEELNRLYSTPSVHIHESVSLGDVGKRKLRYLRRIVPRNEKAPED
jgi:hypothetical protein